MIYLVSQQKSLFETDEYSRISIDDAIDILRPNNLIEYDSETEGLDPYTKRLLCSQYGIPNVQIVIDNTTIPIEKMRIILEDKEKTFLGWNIGFDLKFLYHHRIIPYNVWDGMIAEKLLYLGYPAKFHSLALKEAAHNYLGIDIDKSVRGQIINQGLTIPVIKYAAGDVTYLKQIKDMQDVELKKKDLVKAAEFEMHFVPVISYMEYCGAKIDEAKWKEKMARDLQVVVTAEAKLNRWVEDYYTENKGTIPGTVTTSTEEVPLMEEIKLLDKIPNKGQIRRVFNREANMVKYQFDAPFPYITPFVQRDLFQEVNTNAKCLVNWSSSKQVVPLFEHLGINCTTVDKKSKEKKKSCDIKLIEPQKAKCSIIPLYVEYKKAKILVDTFGQKFLDKRNPVTTRIHPDYYQLGSDTGRISASNPSLLNLPRDEFTRACFVAEKGNKWLSCDYSGQESFLMASIANDKAMLDELVNGSGDLHSLTAKMVFTQIPRDMPLTDVKDQFHELRQEAKGYEFCFNYGGTDSTLVKNYGITRTRAKEIYENYMSGFSGLRDYQEYRRKDVLKRGYILINPITKHKAFIYDWDNLCKISNELDSDEGRYLSSVGNPKIKDESSFLRRRIAESQKQSINYPIQGTGALCTKLAMIKFFNYLRKHDLLFKVKLCILVHDEADVEAPEEIAEEIGDILVKCMEAGGKPFCTKAKLSADISIGLHWIH